MRSEKEIREKLLKLEKKLTCKTCKILCRVDYDGFLTCPRCDEPPDADWEDLGYYKALRWVLEEE
jgi:uncharacterized Zn finger protein (UPF0148 family)